MIKGHMGVFVVMSLIFMSFYSMVAVGESLETNEFSDTNLFEADGFHSHYYIERYNISLDGEVYIYHPANTFDLTIYTTNIKSIVVDVQSLYDDEAGTCWSTLPVDFRSWIISNSEYTITLKTDGNLSSFGFTSSQSLEPHRVLWDDNLMDYTMVDESTYSASVPVQDNENHTVTLYYSLSAYGIGKTMMEVGKMLLSIGIIIGVIGAMGGMMGMKGGGDYGMQRSGNTYRMKRRL